MPNALMKNGGNWFNDPLYAQPGSAYITNQAGSYVPDKYYDAFNKGLDDFLKVPKRGMSMDEARAAQDKFKADLLKKYRREPTVEERARGRQMYENALLTNPSALSAIGWRDPSIWSMTPLKKNAQGDIRAIPQGEQRSGGYAQPLYGDPAYRGIGVISDDRAVKDSPVTDPRGGRGGEFVPIHEGMHAGYAQLLSHPDFKDAAEAIGGPSDKHAQHDLINPSLATLKEPHNVDWGAVDYGPDFAKYAAAGGSGRLSKDENGVWQYNSWFPDMMLPQDRAADLEYLSQQYLARNGLGPR